MLLLTSSADALFCWRVQHYRADNQTGVECSIFRNEGGVRSSELIREAELLAWRRWPGQRLFTFIDPSQIRSSNPGYCFIAAGWARLPGRSAYRQLHILEKWPTTRLGGDAGVGQDVEAEHIEA